LVKTELSHNIKAYKVQAHKYLMFRAFFGRGVQSRNNLLSRGGPEKFRPI